MTSLNYENFRKSDKKEYIIRKNPEFINYYQDKKNGGFSSILSFDEIQKLINLLTMFFEFKYPEKLLDRLRNNDSTEEQIFCECKSIMKKLDIEQLKLRLDDKHIEFLGCVYPSSIRIERKLRESNEMSGYDIGLDSKGKIESSDLEKLRFFKFLDDIDGVNRVEDLLGRYLGYETDIDYSKLEKCVEDHKHNVALRNRVLELTMLSLLYSKGNPVNGYIRVKRFSKMFSDEYNINLSTKNIDDIMKRYYSNSTDKQKKLK